MRAGSKRGRQAHGPRAVPPYGSVRRATANGCSAEHEGQQEGLRAEREADGGMRGRVAPRCGLVLLCMGLVLLFTDGGGNRKTTVPGAHVTNALRTGVGG